MTRYEMRKQAAKLLQRLRQAHSVTVEEWPYHTALKVLLGAIAKSKDDELPEVPAVIEDRLAIHHNRTYKQMYYIPHGVRNAVNNQTLIIKTDAISAERICEILNAAEWRK